VTRIKYALNAGRKPASGGNSSAASTAVTVIQPGVEQVRLPKQNQTCRFPTGICEKFVSRADEVRANLAFAAQGTVTLFLL